jgi:hypothetical protein
VVVGGGAHGERGGGGGGACDEGGGGPTSRNCYRKYVGFTELALPHDWDTPKDNRIMVQNNDVWEG